MSARQTLSTPQSIVLYTGDVRMCSNIASLGASPHCPTAALTGLECTVGCWTKHTKNLVASDSLRIDHPNLMFQIHPEERQKLNIVCKLFVNEGCAPLAVEDAFEKITAEHKIDRFDVALLSLLRKDGQLPGNVQDYWQYLERLQEQGHASSIGVSDFSANELASLLETAKVAPNELQIISEGHDASIAEAADYATSKGLQVGTHGDAAEYATRIERGLPSLFGKLVLEPQPTSFKLLWIARISVIDKTRSVLIDLGYVAHVALSSAASS